MRSDPVADRLSLKINAALDRLAGDMPRVGIALSGGGDSTALLHLAHGWAAGRKLMAATVDHGLRAESASEARLAHAAATALGIAHETLAWRRQGQGGNLMAQARDARLRLLAEWAHRHGLSAVLLGHTQDDQAETLLMRLARGAGVDGLAGMAEARRAQDMIWLRPMLTISRADLRDWLRVRRIGWIDDPSNENEDYDRVRIRKALAALDLPLAQLAQSATNLATARDALQDFADQVAQGTFAHLGSLGLPLAAFRRAPPEIRRRLLVAGLRFVTGADYPPRRETLLRAISVLNTGGRVTLDGVIAQAADTHLRLIREPAAAARHGANADGSQVLWDNRWQIQGVEPGLDIRALGYDAMPDWDWRASGLSRDEAAATPAVLRDGKILAAPVLKPHARISATPLRDLHHFRAFIYTH
ncbi:tRNA lysidine(34) synthetase TilS [Paracoccus laeviglucosivorans]|uniref:tRNA(Ile)-lysidine synthase n=1 Tax=Paracoccus laeviglucosivorans TaxID=1197861 RepID=A0A521EXZ6_9RHOB|nr:tRNA lysidine(34) synthetase TilS [Paracoccus laeviglucosivorans]SMO88799.1 tRNA(Ile)-lysidine synthase [Paracoccus laeviglucosivorans]